MPLDQQLQHGSVDRGFWRDGRGNAVGLTAEAVRQVEPAIPLLQSLLQVAPWVIGAAALAGIAYMIWARIDDRRRGLR
jgi:threonine/homoserine/homoserine lactone efflux protein